MVLHKLRVINYVEKIYKKKFYDYASYPMNYASCIAALAHVMLHKARFLPHAFHLLAAGHAEHDMRNISGKTNHAGQIKKGMVGVDPLPTFEAHPVCITS